MGADGDAVCLFCVGRHCVLGVPANWQVMWYEYGLVQVPLGGASVAAAAFGGVLPPGITGTNDRSTLLVSNLVPEVGLRMWLR